MKQDYYYKVSKVKGNTYLQIWQYGKFIRSCGSAIKLNEKLVRLEELEFKDKTKLKNKTNICPTPKP